MATAEDDPDGDPTDPIDEIRDAVGVDDGLLATLFSAREELRDLRAIVNARDSEGAIETGISKAFTGDLISFPEEGGKFAFPAGTGQKNRHEINLERGRVDVNGISSFEMQSSLDDLETDLAHAALLWADQEVTFFMYDRDDNEIGVFEYDQSSYMALDAVRVAKLRIDAPAPFMFRAQFSSGIETPLRSTAVSTHQERFGRVKTSVTDFTGSTTPRIQWVGINPNDYQEQDLQTAADNYGDPTLWTSSIGQHVWIISEVSGNDDAEIQVREWQIDGQQKAADNDVMGNVNLTNTNTVTVSANDFVVLESDLHTAFKNIVVQSAGGAEVDVRGQYRGYAPGIRR